MLLLKLFYCFEPVSTSLTTYLKYYLIFNILTILSDTLELKKPENFQALKEHVTDTSMNVSWSEVALADEYFLIVGIQEREDDDYRF